MAQTKPIHVIGGGLAGAEATHQATRMGVPVVLHEMRPMRQTDAHVTDALGELVCSNSFRSDDAQTNAVGLLHAELRDTDSLIMRCADAHHLPAGGALAVDREGFAQAVTSALEKNPLVEIQRHEVTAPQKDWDNVIIASGPLTSDALAKFIGQCTGTDRLAFFDAIAPIVYRDSINMDICWHQSRYDKVSASGTDKDYINCPMDKAQYEAFIDALLAGETTDFKQWEKDTPYFNGCLPIEVMASRGRETLRHGPMKPRGLTNAHRPDEKPYAVVQLRQDNALGTLYNIVGFQTKMKYAAQADILRLIPGLEEATFARLGGLHRNTFLNSPTLLDSELRLKSTPALRFAGQITGVEGYVESTAIGALAGRFAAAQRLGRMIAPPPATTAYGALLAHITCNADSRSFQPMNINFGLMPEVPEIAARDFSELKGKARHAAKKLARKKSFTTRARKDFSLWLSEQSDFTDKSHAQQRKLITQ